MNYDGRIERDAEPDASAPAEARRLLDQIDEDERRLRRRNLLLLALAGLALLAVWFVLHHNQPTQLASDASSQAPTVTVIVPGSTMVAGTIGATGTIAARRELPVGSVGDGGEVSAVYVDAGQWVHRGQVLATVDRSVQVEQRANQAAQITAAEADARLAEANLERAQKLVSHGFISKAQIDQLVATRDGAAARVKVAQAQLGEIDARIRRLSIVAPENGLLLERNVDPGQVVGAGNAVLFRIAKDGEMEVQAKLSESDLAQLSLGEAASVTPVGSSQSFTGHIWQLSPEIDPATRQGTARIALAYAPALRPGGFAEVEIRAGTLTAPMLPESALLADNQGNYVFVIGPDNKARRRAIKVGLVTDHGVAIARGLSGDEKVVLRAGAFLSEGESVKPVPAPQG
ncbi:MAG: efflux RND transporter periplasmic adaptor subunit [Sphingomonadales bacterium]|nr:efflux RND transporter periplasmic adaptor subunit [Sphingomonadales bacterium]